MTSFSKDIQAAFDKFFASKKSPLPKNYFETLDKNPLLRNIYSDIFSPFIDKYMQNRNALAVNIATGQPDALQDIVNQHAIQEGYIAQWSEEALKACEQLKPEIAKRKIGQSIRLAASSTFTCTLACMLIITKWQLMYNPLTPLLVTSTLAALAFWGISALLDNDIYSYKPYIKNMLNVLGTMCIVTPALTYGLIATHMIHMSWIELFYKGALITQGAMLGVWLLQSLEIPIHVLHSLTDNIQPIVLSVAAIPLSMALIANIGFFVGPMGWASLAVAAFATLLQASICDNDTLEKKTVSHLKMFIRALGNDIQDSQPYYTIYKFGNKPFTPTATPDDEINTNTVARPQ